MYLSYYGLYKEPYHITPDPDFLFQSPCHREAYATMAYGIAQRKGFIAVTGEVGTGKTTILRAYLNSLDSSKMQTTYVYSPDMSFDELMRVLLTELGEELGETNAANMTKLQWKLVNLFQEGRSMLLVIDEAQNMPVDTLEKLRTLSNLETTKDKLLQIILVGQPELDEKLNLHQLRQLKQRIAVRAKLRPLNKEESAAYMKHRFECAGGDFEGLFHPAALRALVRHAKGSPRALNILGDNALVAGFGAEQRPIMAKLVNDVARELEGPKRGISKRVVWAAAAASVALAAIGIGWSAWPGASDSRSSVYAAASTQPQPDATTPEPKHEPAAPAPAPVETKPVVPVTPDTPVQAAVSKPVETPAPVVTAPAPVAPKTETPSAAAPMAPDAPVLPVAAKPEITPEPTPAPVAEPPAANTAVPEPAKPVETAPAVVDAPKEASALSPISEKPDMAAVPVVPDSPVQAPAPAKAEAPAAKPTPAPEVGKPAKAEVKKPVETPPAAPIALEDAPAIAPPAPTAPAEATHEAPAPKPVSRKAVPAKDGEMERVVLSGETLTGLCRQFYGRTDESLLRAMQARNPFITDVDMILTGETLVFPTVAGLAPVRPADAPSGS